MPSAVITIYLPWIFWCAWPFLLFYGRNVLIDRPLRWFWRAFCDKIPLLYNIGIKIILKIFSKLFAGLKKVVTFATAFER